MNANELRIGNMVYKSLKSGQGRTVINPIGCQDIVRIFEDIGSFNYAPIPITEDILLKCGFEYDFISYNLHFGIDWHNGVLRFSQGKGQTIFLPCTHLHQLQNLYFALTQKELTIKL